MAETDPAATSSHVVIDVEGAAGDDDEEALEAAATSSSCVVCTEPMEWVAVSPCGHREVCVRCVARIRFVHNDRRCCICRTHCATVVVTRADRATTTHGGFPFLSPPPQLPVPPASFGA